MSSYFANAYAFKPAQIARLVAHTVYYCTLCAITATARNSCSPNLRFAHLTCRFVCTRHYLRTQKPVLTWMNTGLNCMLCGTWVPALALALTASDATALALAAPEATALVPALTRNAQHRPWRRGQRTVAPAQEHSRQRPEPRGRCAHPHQDGFRHQSEALQ